MTQFAQYNPTAPAPSPVVGWYDTSAFTYAVLPPENNLLVLTETQWDDHFANPNAWAVSNGALVSYTPPVPQPTIAQQAQALLNAGLQIVSASTPSLDATYACDSQTTAYINAEITSILLDNTFADGSSTIDWPDVQGDLHNFSVDEFKSFAKAIGNFVSLCRACIIGSSTTLPSNSAKIP